MLRHVKIIESSNTNIKITTKKDLKLVKQFLSTPLTGIGIDFKDGDLALRGNFATLDDNDVIIDRRAGRQIEKADALGVSQELEDKLKFSSPLSGIVIAPKFQKNLKHVEFIRLNSTQLMLILAYENGEVENRIIEDNGKYNSSLLIQASNYLTSKFTNKNISQIKKLIQIEIKNSQNELELISSKLISYSLHLNNFQYKHLRRYPFFLLIRKVNYIFLALL